MAGLLTTDQIEFIHGDGRTDHTAFFAVKKCNTGDTVDVAAWFKAPKLALVLWTTTAKSDKLAVPVGTIITLSTTGLNDDSGWLIVWGSKA